MFNFKETLNYLLVETVGYRLFPKGKSSLQTDEQRLTFMYAL